MEKKAKKNNLEIISYQPDAVEIEERPVPGKVRWVLYVILLALVATAVGASIFQVDRVVVAEGSLITTSPTIVVQPLNTAVVRSIEVQVGDIVESGQVLALLDSTFVSADLDQLKKRAIVLSSQLRRIQAELKEESFVALPDEEQDGKLQEHLFEQRKIVFKRNKQLSDQKISALKSKLSLNRLQQQGKEQQLKLIHDMEGTTARLPQNGVDYRLRLLEVQRERLHASDESNKLEAEEQIISHELKQVQSEWHRFVEERTGELMEQEVQLRVELTKINEEISKAQRLHELVSLRAPQKGIVLNMAELSVGSIIRQAEPFITLVPIDSTIEAEVNIVSKDIARVRVGDSTRVKLDAFPFQRHDTLTGEVRVISENSFAQGAAKGISGPGSKTQVGAAFYRTRVNLLSKKLRNVPDGFRLIPGMKVRAEIKVGQRRVISYFLYPVIRALDESLREP